MARSDTDTADLEAILAITGRDDGEVLHAVTDDDMAAMIA